jgi:hypothetical protein
VTSPPDSQDAEIILRIMEIYLSEPVRSARTFWRTIPDGLSFDELVEKYPRGSENFQQIDTIMIFWETVGGLLKQGLLREDLAFDTFLDAPPWKKIEAAFRQLRQEAGNEAEGENLEYAYRRSVQWKSSPAANDPPS